MTKEPLKKFSNDGCSSISMVRTLLIQIHGENFRRKWDQTQCSYTNKIESFLSKIRSSDYPRRLILFF